MTLRTVGQHFMCQCTKYIIDQWVEYDSYCTKPRRPGRLAPIGAPDCALRTSMGQTTRGLGQTDEGGDDVGFARLVPSDLRAPARAVVGHLRRNLMLNSKTLDELAARIGKAIENSPAKDIEKNVKAMLRAGSRGSTSCRAASSTCRRRCCCKTREKLEQLEARVAELEARFASPPPLDALTDATARRAFRSGPAMSVAVVHSRALAGVDAPLVTVEVHSAAACPAFTSSACRKPRCARRAIACARRCRTRVRSFRRARSPSISRRRSAEGVRALRPADRARHPRRDRPDTGRRAGAATSSPASSR